MVGTLSRAPEAHEYLMLVCILPLSRDYFSNFLIFSHNSRLDEHQKYDKKYILFSINFGYVYFNTLCKCM